MTRMEVVALSGLLLLAPACTTYEHNLTHAHGTVTYTEPGTGKKVSLDYESDGIADDDAIRKCTSPTCEIVRQGEDSYRMVLYHPIQKKLVQYGNYEKMDCFYGSRARVRDDGRYGFIDLDGKLVIGTRFKAAREFQQGLAAVKDLDGKWGIVRPDGDFLVTPRFHGVILTEKAPLIALVSLEQVKEIPVPADPRGTSYHSSDRFKVGRWAFIGSNGEVRIDPKVDAVLGWEGYKNLPDDSGLPYFSADYFPARSAGGKWGYLNQEGRFVIEPRFDFAGDFRLDYNSKEDKVIKLPARVQLNGKWGNLERSGQVAWDR